MNSFRIAVKLFKTNIKTYGYYLAVMIIAVAVYYDFAYLKYNSAVLKARDMVQMAETASGMTSFILLVFLIFFMWYSSSFFLKQRKKEIGLYMLAGISNRSIAAVFAIESLMLGITAIFSGLALGMLLSKLFMMVLAKVTLLKVSVAFSVPIKGIIETVVIFVIIFMALSVRSFIGVAGSRLISLINGAKKEEGEPKIKIIRGILSLLLIAAGYYISFRIMNGTGFLGDALLVVFLVVWGTFWLFGSLLSSVLKVLLARKDILYKGPRIISISNMAFRLKGNYRGLAMICVLVATTITAFATSLSLRYYVDKTHHIEFPYSFSYLSEDPGLSVKVAETIKESDHQLLLQLDARFLDMSNVMLKGVNTASMKPGAVKFSDFFRITRDLKVENGDELLKRNQVSDKKAIYIQAPTTIGSVFENKGSIFIINNDEYEIIDSLKMPLFGEGALGSRSMIVVSDEAYDDLKKSFPEKTFNGFIISEPENSQDLALKLYNIVPKDAGFLAYVAKYQMTYSTMGLFYFLGTFMSVVFMLAIGSVMYFKLLSEALADRGKYDILSKIGMSGKEIKGAVSLQVGLSLILPLAIGIMHSFFAINVLEDMLDFNLTFPTIMASIVFAVIYIIFYGATTRKFIKLICPE